MKALIIAENEQGKLNKNLFSVISAANKITQDVSLLIVGEAAKTLSEDFKQYNIKKIYFSSSENFYHGLAENICKLILEIAREFTHIFAPASSFGKNIMPRVAALLDVNQISDITDILDAHTFIRPIFAGNALATVICEDPIKVITVRCTAFPENNLPGQTFAEIQELIFDFKDKRIQFVNNVKELSTRPSLAHAKIVVSGGRGLQSKENFKALLEPLAEKLGAAIGASRAAVDAGFADNSLQVGQTGLVVAPDLYIAIGLSGAIQHLAGMKDSKVIVSINQDPNAEIMRIADYALEADLFAVIPELLAMLS